MYAATISQGQTAVVIAIRADFYVRSAAHAQLADCMSENQVTITPMDEHELTEAIELPAKKVGLSFEAGLVDTIREDVLGQPGALPTPTATTPAQSVAGGQVGLSETN